MHRILTSILGLHWMAHFGVFAVAALGLSSTEAPLMPRVNASADLGDVLATGLAVGYGVAAILFLWLLVSAALDRRTAAGDTDHVARLATAMALALLTALALAAAAGILTVSTPTILLQGAALLGSYLAIDAEWRRVAETAGEVPETGASAMALSAAHNALLIRISGRSGAKGSL